MNWTASFFLQKESMKIYYRDHNNNHSLQKEIDEWLHTVKCMQLMPGTLTKSDHTSITDKRI